MTNEQAGCLFKLIYQYNLTNEVPKDIPFELYGYFHSFLIQFKQENVGVINNKGKRNKINESELNDFFEGLPDLNWSNLLKDWLMYKKERNEGYKSVSSIKVFCRNLIGLSNGEYLLAEQIINQSIGNNWAGIFALKNNNQNGKSINTAEAEQAEFRRVAEMLRRTVSNNSRPS